MNAPPNDLDLLQTYGLAVDDYSSVVDVIERDGTDEMLGDTSRLFDLARAAIVQVATGHDGVSVSPQRLLNLAAAGLVGCVLTGNELADAEAVEVKG